MMTENSTSPEALPSLRYEWYQTDDDIIFSLLIKQCDLSLLEHTVQAQTLHFKYPGYAPLDLELSNKLDTSVVSPCTVKSTRLEWNFSKLHKKEHWASLIQAEDTNPKLYPSSA
ncbi:hypothetical protein HMI55_005958, partial [Coelomomyces lativittatus]